MAPKTKTDQSTPRKRTAPHVHPLMWQVLAFVKVFRETYDRKKAAIAAGYDENNAGPVASHMLKDPRVIEELSKQTLDAIARSSLSTAEMLRVLEEHMRLDVADACAPDGSLLPVAKMPKHVRQSIKEISYDAKGRRRVKFESRQGAAELLMRHRGLLKDVVEHQITVKRLETMSDDQLLNQMEADSERLRRHFEARKRLRVAVSQLPEAQKV